MVKTLLLLALPAVAAATPVTLSHQGRLLDATGVPLQGPQQVTVALHASEGSASSFWSDTFAVNANDGYVSVILGSDETLDTADLLRDEVWIEYIVGTSLGRQRLLSVPYAAVARSVDGGRGRFDGAVTLGSEEDSFCGPATAGSLVWNAASSQVQVCDGTRFRSLGGTQIVLDGTSRRWSDGTLARDCNAYRNPTGSYEYAGDTGTGVYTIDPDGDGNGFDAA